MAQDGHEDVHDMDDMHVDDEKSLFYSEKTVQNQVFIMSGRWGFTAWSLTDAMAMVTWLCAFLYKKCDDYVFQLERSESGMYHFQMYLKLKEKQRPKTTAMAWNDDTTGIELSAASNAGREALKTYAMKSATRVAGPWGKREIYMGQDLITELLPWQAKLYHYMNKPPHPREIVWFVDVGGRAGKTAMGKFLAYHLKALYMSWGPTKDILSLVAESDKTGRYIFNLSRTKPATFASDDLYSALESIKDGAFLNTKYKTSSVLMKPPHVVVFANQAPDKAKMSSDRFNVIDLKDVVKPHMCEAESFTL